MKEGVTTKSDSETKLEISINNEITGEENLFSGRISSTIQEHLLSNYKENNTSLKDKFSSAKSS